MGSASLHIRCHKPWLDSGFQDNGAVCGQRWPLAGGACPSCWRSWFEVLRPCAVLNDQGMEISGNLLQKRSLLRTPGASSTFELGCTFLLGCLEPETPSRILKPTQQGQTQRPGLKKRLLAGLPMLTRFLQLAAQNLGCSPFYYVSVLSQGVLESLLRTVSIRGNIPTQNLTVALSPLAPPRPPARPPLPWIHRRLLFHLSRGGQALLEQSHFLTNSFILTRRLAEKNNTNQEKTSSALSRPEVADKGKAALTLMLRRHFARLRGLEGGGWGGGGPAGYF